MKNGSRLRIISQEGLKQEMKNAKVLREMAKDSDTVVRGNNEDIKNKLVKSASASTEVISFLKVDIIEARDLPAMDMNGIFPFFLVTFYEMPKF